MAGVREQQAFLSHLMRERVTAPLTPGQEAYIEMTKDEWKAVFAEPRKPKPPPKRTLTVPGERARRG